MGDNIKRFSIYLQAKTGEEVKKALFNKIWQKYYRRVWLFSGGILKDQKAVIDDTVQEIMLKVFKNLDKFNPRYSFCTWIFTIARNTCLNRMNKKRIRTKMLMDNVVDSSNTNPEEVFLEKNTRQQVRSFINNLSEQNAQIAYLRFYENLKIKQISHVTQMPVGTIKYKIHNIKQNLKNYLLEEDYVN